MKDKRGKTKGAGWAFFAVLGLASAIAYPRWYFALLLITALLILPIEGYQRLLDRIFKKRWMKPVIIGALLLAIAAAVAVPIIIKPKPADTSALGIIESGGAEKIEHTPEPSLIPAETIGGEKDGKTEIEVHFIDVGQGDSTLVLCGGEAMLIDGGSSGCSQLMYAYLKAHGIDHLDYIVCTHPHDDHGGGLAGALNFAEAETGFSTVSQYDSRAFSSFLKYLDEKGGELIIPQCGYEFSLGQARVQFLGPVTREDENINNLSLVTKITLGETSFLIMADAETPEEESILRAGYDVSADVLRLGHHGSSTSSSEAFLSAVSPEIAVISVGADNEYGHPSEDVLKRLSDKGIGIYRTDLQGDIICRSDGSAVEVLTEKELKND